MQFPAAPSCTGPPNCIQFEVASHRGKEAAMDRVGVIGLGKMGLPIARNLMVRGFHVTGYRRSGSPELLREGGEVASSAAEVAAEADVILSIVPTADDVEEIIAGPAGTLVNLKPGTIHIEMSTIDVDRKGRLRDQVRARAATCSTARSPAARAWSRRGRPPRSPRATSRASTP
jgi:hypothetical protein